MIVQRALASRDMSHAKGACIMAGWLKLLPLFIMIFPGMAARVLFPDEVRQLPSLESLPPDSWADFLAGCVRQPGDLHGHLQQVLCD